ncbi:uncharacterized protein LOC111322155 [Stylophora pistillata]|uniref:uncharacterized protein LOC111322155 n=1 Tax=Stylophora pistillata TaxID=50429 RepID=UPI000C03EBE6|nr:uncharacterized protein LOC111322155 [Stylophora pistillata]
MACSQKYISKSPLFYVMRSILFMLLWLCHVRAQESAGQKAHFQVEDKSGDLKILATKDQAKVTAQADSVQVVVKPGTAEYPVLKSDKPVVHVTQAGWNSISFRKSKISRRKMPVSSQVKKKHHVNNSKKPMVHLNTVANKQGRITLKRGPYFIKTNNLKRKHEKQSLQSVSGSKKSDVKYGGFQVLGNAGKLKMHVTKDETTLSSESGGVDISLNKQSSSSAKSSKASNQRTFDVHRPQKFTEESADKTVHIATELENGLPDIGLRKSEVTRLHENKINRPTR